MDEKNPIGQASSQPIFVDDTDSDRLPGTGHQPTPPSSKPSIADRLRHIVLLAYQHTVVELILRRKHINVAHDGRHIPLAVQHDVPLVDTRRGTGYVSNDIRTSRYTLWDFIPKQLFWQFSRVGNFYFLCVGIPQTIPGLSTTGSYTTILPLMFFVLVTIAKEGFDDFRRHRLDVVENANFATILGTKDPYTGNIESAGFLQKWNIFRAKITAKPQPMPDDSFQGVKWVPERWSNLKVGHVIRLVRDEPVPADLVLLHSDGENGLAYIDTMDLDGETSLKTRQVCHAIEGCETVEGIANCNAEFVIEDPNPHLFQFDGKVSVNGKTVPLTLNEIVYRGSVLRNTGCIHAIIVNTGEECKVRMNANQHPKAKKPALERVVNKIVLTLAVYVIVLSVGVSMGYIQFQRDFEDDTWYLQGARVPFHQIIIAFIIMFNNVIPLSLYISLEIVKVGQLLMLNSDMEMYDEETDTPARCNTNTILENLGQVGYIFSDKTGTLTDNIMKFRKISVAGTTWLHEMDLDQDEPVDESTDDAAVIKEVDTTSSSDASIVKLEPLTIVVPEIQTPAIEVPMSPSRPSMGRRSSSHWRSTGRPDHVQPEVNTSDLIRYMELRPHSAFARKARDYLLAVALCHTCLPEQRNGKLDYQAASPDELALVKAAADMGHRVLSRTTRTITLEVSQPSGDTAITKFDILDVIEFSSARKRMSILIRYPDGRIAVICKGADSAILPRLRLSSLAEQKAKEARKSADLDHELHRRSEQMEPRNSFGGRPSLALQRPSAVRGESLHRLSMANRSKSFEASHLVTPADDSRRNSYIRGASLDVPKSAHLASPTHHQAPTPDLFNFLDTPEIYDEAEVFAKCFRHLDEFATEGLRTLLYAQRFMTEQDYATWKLAFDEATTSLVDRQERIEAVADTIEQSFELVGATAIEDKLQKGVPETVDRLRRANIKIWMLTGDKRETAINIAHSARICRPGSDLYILDAQKGPLESQLTDISVDLGSGSGHSVVVIDGYTLSVVEKTDELSTQFFDVMIRVDSVICCRASPAQKSLLVRTMRSRLRSFKGKDRRGLTLAIGDGANDLAMISASHVGVGISGKEGLQAARVADYSIAQFRFLQRLLLVHGRWNYVRTAKFIIATFWKEMFFYLPTAQYQRYNGYTGTSLYEATSLTVFNTLFTSLCTICMGIWEQDLQADTLLAIPELYVYGQRNMGLNLTNYVSWMFLAAVEGIITWYGVWAGYGWFSASVRDEGLYALGQLTFTVGVLWINWKLFIFETHYKTTIVMFSFFLTTWGWFAWNAFLDGVFAAQPSGTYAIRHTFTRYWGDDPIWWATVFVVLGFLGLFELVGKAAKRKLLVAGLWRLPSWAPRFLGSRRGGGGPGDGSSPEEWDLTVWQELEQDPLMSVRLRRMARDVDGDEDDDHEAEAAAEHAEALAKELGTSPKAQ